MQARWLVVGLLVILAPASAAPDLSYQVEGVTYHKAHGLLGSGNLSTGLDYEGTSRLAFQGCADIAVRDSHDLGRLQMFGRLGGIPIELDSLEFKGGHPDMDGGVATDVAVDGSHTHGSIQHPAVPAALAAWGEAQLRIGDRIVYDPVTGRSSFDLTVFVTSTGFREDATGRVRNSDGSAYVPGDRAVREKGDWEMHMRLESAGGQPQAPYQEQRRQPPADFGAAYFPPGSEISERVWIPNVRYGGNLTVEISSSSQDPLGQTALNFTLIDPQGKRLGSLEASPAMGRPFVGRLDQPLDQLGEYILQVSGTATLSDYRIRIVQTTPATFDWNFWWEDLALGSEARGATSACTESVSGRDEVLSGSVVAREPPPTFPYTIAAFITTGVAAAVLVVVKLLMMGRAAALHRQLVEA